jgi:hypothetical protein
MAALTDTQLAAGYWLQVAGDCFIQRPRSASQGVQVPDIGVIRHNWKTAEDE